MYGNHANRDILETIICEDNWDSGTNGEAICQPINIHDHSDHNAHGQTRCAESRSRGTATSPARHRDDKIRICARTGLHRPARMFQNDPPRTGKFLLLLEKKQSYCSRNPFLNQVISFGTFIDVKKAEERGTKLARILVSGLEILQYRLPPLCEGKTKGEITEVIKKEVFDLRTVLTAGSSD